jgi:hypothetical protein
LRISNSTLCRISAYGNGKDGTFSLADARRERDKAKDLLKEGKDPSTEKQLVKHRQAAARPFDKWAAKKKLEKAKRGRIVAVRDPKTIEVLELRVGCVKDRFGKVTCSNRLGCTKLHTIQNKTANILVRGLFRQNRLKDILAADVRFAFSFDFKGVDIGMAAH